MTREQAYQECVKEISSTNCLLIELPTGFGKSKLSVDMTNYLINSQWYKDNKIINILLLVDKRVHKQTWKEEIEKWGNIHHPSAQINICMECYKSLKNHSRERWDIVLADEVHHIGSETRLEILKTMSFGYFLGLSATIPFKLKKYFDYKYHSREVSCDLTEAIEDNVLPQPEILLFPLILDNRKETETWEYYPKASGKAVHAKYKDLKKYKFNKKIHSFISMTQKQKYMEYENLVEYFKGNFLKTKNLKWKRSWSYQAGKRLEYLAEVKLPIVKDILKELEMERTITFCKTVSQAEAVGKWCIHSKNANADKFYKDFNDKKIDHISAVNILNENANLVDCRCTVFCNLSSSDVVIPQRLGRALRHKHPIIIVPYYEDTREKEIVDKMFEEYNKDFIKTIQSIKEIKNYVSSNSTSS